MYEIISNYKGQLWEGLKVTLELCGIIYSCGFIIGTGLGILQHRSKILSLAGFWFSLIVSSIPVFVMLFWSHFSISFKLQTLNIIQDPIDDFYTTVFVLSIFMISMVSNQIKNVLNEFPHQYILSGKACGLSNTQIMKKIQFPIIWKQVLPSFLFYMVIILQSTLFASYIGVGEILKETQNIITATNSPIELYSILAIFFILICGVLNFMAYRAKSKIKWSSSEI
jgi:ABC-type amino acid transport system permease subunit